MIWSFKVFLFVVIFMTFIVMFISDFQALIKTHKKIFIWDLLLDTALVIGMTYLTDYVNFF